MKVTLEQVLMLIATLLVVFANSGIVTRKITRVVATVQQLCKELHAVWQFLHDRGNAALINGGRVEKRDGQFFIPEEILNRFAPITDSLRALAAEPVNLMDSDHLAMRIGRKYGRWLVKNICIPFRYDKGECLAIAVSVARGRKSVSA